jgi:hypothetical protein
MAPLTVRFGYPLNTRADPGIEQLVGVNVRGPVKVPVSVKLTSPVRRPDIAASPPSLHGTLVATEMAQ